MNPRGPNERALGATLTARGVDTRARHGELAALITLARTCARQLDATEEPSASMASAYRSVLRQLLDATKPEEVPADEQPAETLRRLRTV